MSRTQFYSIKSCGERYCCQLVSLLLILGSLVYHVTLHIQLWWEQLMTFSIWEGIATAIESHPLGVASLCTIYIT